MVKLVSLYFVSFKVTEHKMKTHCIPFSLCLQILCQVYSTSPMFQILQIMGDLPSTCNWTVHWRRNFYTEDIKHTIINVYYRDTCRKIRSSKPTYNEHFLTSKTKGEGDKSYLNERVNVQHQSLGPADDKLIDTCNSMGSGNKILTFLYKNIMAYIQPYTPSPQKRVRFLYIIPQKEFE